MTQTVKASWKRDDESRTGTNPQALKWDEKNTYYSVNKNKVMFGLAPETK